MAGTDFKFVEWDNGAIRLRGALLLAHESKGPWCIFSHGFTGHHIGPGYLFVRLSRELAAAGISSLRFDYAGCGDSEGSFREMTVDTMKSDLFSATRLIRERFSPSRLIYLGHSLGGMVAALCAVEAVVDGIALLSPVAEPAGLTARRKEMIKCGTNAEGFFENGPHEISPAFLDGLQGMDPAKRLAASFKGSLFLAQGDHDVSISVEEGCRYSHAAMAAGIETTECIIEGADHNYTTVRNFAMICSMVTAWAKERFV